MLARRTLLASALALPACTTAPVRTAASAPPCLPRVRAEQGRIIRSVAGLRPWRAGGFVVRAEPLGAKRLIHNYGHGGGGITLSWGSARLAVDLAQGMAGPVAVIGSGAVGLATARLAQDAGHAVTLYTAALPPDTTSNIAGGQIVPTGHYEEGMVSAAWFAQYRAAMDYSWRRFQILAGDRYGINWVPTWQPAFRQPPDPADPEAFLLAYQPAQSEFAAGSHPFGNRTLRRFDTMYVETGRYLDAMLSDFHLRGGRLVRRAFVDRQEVAALPEPIVFNCTGLGARALFGDRDLVPVRGQLAILLPQPEIDYAYAMGGGYMFPRADGILLGGTFERGEEDATPVAADIAAIVAGHARIAADWRCPA
ncbi:FAD-dependent oxidoreductase [Sphingomonas baiyangensis]|uniref:D-amino-acid oxidase n=1 Tax=Sphingomonas baiyangensis TaxID=2572576 RepID=A0A4U1L6F1_9SPHN|nr:FAD-dependent oxidoreductase [Sphingomonas baiyangensis]TKD51796.1 FAD-dependent oxidoreductase [Sphingomonas baiyangensis]